MNERVNWQEFIAQWGDRLPASQVWAVDIDGEPWSFFTSGLHFVGERGGPPGKAADAALERRLREMALLVTESEETFVPAYGLRQYASGFPWECRDYCPGCGRGGTEQDYLVIRDVLGLAVNPRLITAVFAALGGEGLCVGRVPAIGANVDMLAFRGAGQVAGIMPIVGAEGWP